MKGKITEEMVAEFVRLRRAGRSFRSIGKEYKLDRRTVKAWVERVGKEESREHWEAISRTVDAERLDEHYRLLVRLAGGLLEAVSSDALTVSPELEAKWLLDFGAQSALRQAGDILKNRGIKVDSASGAGATSTPSGEHAVKRLGRKLLDALGEHEPELARAMKEWGNRWDDFQQVRADLAGQAGGLIKQKGISDAAAEALQMEVAQEALAVELLGRKRRISQVQDTSGGQKALIRRSEEGAWQVYRGSPEEVEALRRVYEGVLAQVSHKARIEQLETARRSLRDAVAEVETIVDRLVLAGRPVGHCALCPARPQFVGKEV